MIYDLIIVGAGCSGSVAAYEAYKQGLLTLVIEKGESLKNRKDPVYGWFGHALTSLSRLDIEDEDDENVKEIISICKQNKFELKDSKCEIFDNFKFIKHKSYYFKPTVGVTLAQYFFNKKQNVIFNTQVESIVKKDDIFIISTSNNKTYFSKKCLIATGQRSVEPVSTILKQLKVNSNLNSNFGIRIELPSKIIKKVCEKYGDFIININNSLLVDDLRLNSVIEPCEDNWSDDGLITSYSYQTFGRKTSKSNFRLSAIDSNFENPLRVAKIINIHSNDNMKKEKIKNVLKDSILKEFKEIRLMLDGIKVLSHIFTKFNETAVVYMPDLKINGIVNVDDKMRTNLSGLYAAGHCAGKNSTLKSLASGLKVVSTIKGDME